MLNKFLTSFSYLTLLVGCSMACNRPSESANIGSDAPQGGGETANTLDGGADRTLIADDTAAAACLNTADVQCDDTQEAGPLIDAAIVDETSSPAIEGELCALGKTWSAGTCQSAKFPTKMLLMPATQFEQGCDPTKGTCYAWDMPVHRVQLSAFLIEETEVTAGQYRACVDADKCAPGYVPTCGPGCSWTGEYCDTYSGLNMSLSTYADPSFYHLPMTFVTRTMAQQYCEAMLPGGSLPTDAQWERAARTDCTANTDTIVYSRYIWGSQWPPPKGAGNLCDSNCWFPSGQLALVYDDGVKCAAKPGSFALDSKCLKDMTGNVGEWVIDDGVADWYTNPLAGMLDPVASGNPNSGVLRGGSFGTSGEQDAAISRRLFRNADAIFVDLGFRCVSNWKKYL